MSARRFFYKVVEAHVTFEADSQGRTIALILHQNGINQRAKQIDGPEGKAPPGKAP